MLITEVLIIGAGPTGLVLALWLARFGVRVRIIDKAAEPGTTSRALAVQARTLELYSQIGLADDVVERGRPVTAANMWVAGRQVARAVFGDMGAGISRYPYALIFPQDEHERLLIDHLAEAGVHVERSSELVRFETGDDRVLAHLKLPDGTSEICETAYLAGCDGADSVVRKGLNIGFPGGTYAHRFYVADVEARGEVMNGEVHVALDRSDFLVVFPRRAEGRARLVGTIREEAEQRVDNLSWDDVGKRVIDSMRIDVARVNWFSTYRVHHRVADRFREGREFLLGDAAHIHSPVGGQGMNTGIGDAVNLGWKLATVLRGRADAAILNSYETERIAFARRLVATTDRAFRGVTNPGVLAQALRLYIVPLLIPWISVSQAVRRLMFRTISQTAINYRESALSEGHLGRLHGGDRLPWVKTGSGGRDGDNYTSLTSLDWQVHVYGDAAREIHEICGRRRLPLHVFGWQDEMARSGLQRDALYLVRPDGYLAMPANVNPAAALASYLDARGISPTR